MRPKDILASVRRFQIETGIRDPYVDSHLFPEKAIPRKSTRTVFRMNKTTAEERAEKYKSVHFNLATARAISAPYNIGIDFGTGEDYSVFYITDRPWEAGATTYNTGEFVNKEWWDARIFGNFGSGVKPDNVYDGTWRYADGEDRYGFAMTRAEYEVYLECVAKEQGWRVKYLPGAKS